MLAGAGFGAAQALHAEQERKLREFQVKENARIAQEELARRVAEDAAQREIQLKQLDMADLRRRDLNNERGIDLMRGDKQQMDADAAIASLPAHLKPLEGLIRIGAMGKLSTEDLMSPEARSQALKDAEEREIRIRNATRPPTQPRDRKPEWVQMPDGSFKDLNDVAPPGARPATPASANQQADKAAAHDRALKSMKAYGDDMLSVIDRLIDEGGNLNPQIAGVIGGIQGARPEWAYLTEESQAALADIDRLQSMLNINTLRDMKEQSRTGATGFGSLTERELNVVESSASKLRRRRQGDAEYAAELKRLRDTLRAGRGGASTPTVNTPAPNAGVAVTDLVYDPQTKTFKPKGGD